MADIDLSTLSYGVDTNKLRTVSENIKNDFKTVRNMVYGGDLYKNVINTVNAHWEGEDKKEFIARFQVTAQAISDAIKRAETNIVKAIDEQIKTVQYDQSKVKSEIETSLNKLN